MLDRSFSDEYLDKADKKLLTHMFLPMFLFCQCMRVTVKLNKLVKVFYVFWGYWIVFSISKHDKKLVVTKFSATLIWELPALSLIFLKLNLVDPTLQV